MEKIKTICCECGDLIHDGPMINGYSSHGYCGRCMEVILAFINGEDDYDREHAQQMQSIDF